MDNPPRELVNSCCNNCPLLASKPGHVFISQNILAAADSAARLKRQLESNLATIIYGPDDISARRAAALDAYMDAESRSDKNRFAKPKKTSNKIPENDPSSF
jgi:hypothetical protein